MSTNLTLDQLRIGLSTADAAALFDSLPAVAIDDIIGRTWHGGEVPTGHPMDGTLSLSGWYGKRFDDADHVHPLLFGEPGSLYAVNPKVMPVGLLLKIGRRLPRRIPGVGLAMKALRTRRHRARLRVVEYHAGPNAPAKASAAMSYDDQPIIDHFRWLDANTLLGAMDLRGSTDPYFFYLQRVAQ
ncbi:DUF4334 domain-containing protein [Gordonia sp. TBRC 11910]|uniref:DUF4334 domain-containing protein n=1 Tax=Gordonia asplenii TaxID=2725283 RepID=A0A848L2T4_9ACTN|nr:GXWXG domain-containing protein [Gordonia asplenii]NMO04742.1 DUF4334 domain-containing protein [Gordonia asplenii]